MPISPIFVFKVYYINISTTILQVSLFLTQKWTLAVSLRTSDFLAHFYSWQRCPVPIFLFFYQQTLLLPFLNFHVMDVFHTMVHLKLEGDSIQYYTILHTNIDLCFRVSPTLLQVQQIICPREDDRNTCTTFYVFLQIPLRTYKLV